jgi:hypothetical protein
MLIFFNVSCSLNLGKNHVRNVSGADDMSGFAWLPEEVIDGTDVFATGGPEKCDFLRFMQAVYAWEYYRMSSCHNGMLSTRNLSL